MLVESIVGLVAIVAVGVYWYKRYTKFENTTYDEGLTLTYDDIYPPSLTSMDTVTDAKDPVVEEKPTKPTVAKKMTPKKRRRPTKKTKNTKKTKK